MPTQNRSQTFDSLVSGLNGDERKALLTKMQNGATSEISTLETNEEFADSDDKGDFKTRLQQESFLLRVWLWIKSIFTNTSVEQVYNNTLVAQIAHNVQAQTPGLIDYHHQYLSNDFYEKLVELKHAADFFSGCIQTYEKNPGSFYVLLGSLIMPQIGDTMDKEADPYQYALTKEANTEMRTSLLRKMDDILQKIPSDKKSEMYMCVRSVEWLRQFTKLPFTEFISKFTSVVDNLNTCSFDVVENEISAFAHILYNGRTIPDEVIEALYLYSVRQVNAVELDDIDGKNSGASFMDTAAAQISVISMFITTVPMRSVACIVYNNALLVPEAFGGGEEWFVKYKAEWKKLFDRKWESWIRDCKKEKLKTKLMDYFTMATFPLFPVRPWGALWGGVPFSYEMTLGFLNNFFKEQFTAYEKVLKIVTLEGDFSIKDNRYEFNDTVNMFENIYDALKELATKLSNTGEYGVEFLRYQEMKGKTKSGVQKINMIMEQVEDTVEGLIASFGDACRTIDKLLTGLLSSKIDSHYGNLTNMSTIQGRDNKKFRDDLEKCTHGIEHAFEIVKELEPIDKPITE